MTKFDILLSVTPLIKPPSASLKLDCKAVRIFAYSSTRQQSNEPISLQILRKNPTVLQSTLKQNTCGSHSGVR